MHTTERGYEHSSPDATGRPAPNGRFAPGNGGGPGNPYARRVAELRQVMLECVTPKEMEIIVGELMVQAKCGNLAAIKLLFQYVIGKPPASVDPDTLDLQEMEQYRRAPEHKELRETIAARMPADVACNLMRGVLPLAGRIEANYLAEAIRNPERELDEDDEEEFEPPPATCAAPSPNGDTDADASRRRTTPPPADGPDRPAAHRDGRTAPRPPADG